MGEWWKKSGLYLSNKDNSPVFMSASLVLETQASAVYICTLAGWMSWTSWHFLTLCNFGKKVKWTELCLMIPQQPHSYSIGLLTLKAFNSELSHPPDCPPAAVLGTPPVYEFHSWFSYHYLFFPFSVFREHRRHWLNIQHMYIYHIFPIHSSITYLFAFLGYVNSTAVHYGWRIFDILISLPLSLLSDGIAELYG